MLPEPLDPSTILIVTGAHLEAEVHHRPLAYFLRGRLLESLGVDAPATSVIVCSDLWYMNHSDLRRHATISLGAPRHSAAAAYLAARLPSVLAVDGVYVVQMDLDADPPLASCWGDDAESTATAVQAFADRLLDPFLNAAVA
ncbi:MAG: hypothetical protein HBSAPP03_05620 [Phycisphaerae bacterium]|nr:MAG: hypothetical protein HBSAPP03_05620 [Phycisphaerae bacterium]